MSIPLIPAFIIIISITIITIFGNGTDNGYNGHRGNKKTVPEKFPERFQENRRDGVNGVTPSKKPFLSFVIDPELLQRIDDFRFRHRFESRASAIKWLLERALDEQEKRAEKEKGRE